MSTYQEINHRTEQQDHKSRPWAWIAIAVVAVLAIAGIAWFAVGDDGTSDIDVATELVDTLTRGWVENDPEMVGSVFTDDGMYSDNVEGFGNPGVWTKEQTMNIVRSRGDAITEAARVSDLTATGDGTFTYVAEFTTDIGQTYSGVVEIELDGDLASRIEWLSLENITHS